jgi:hypothetical protein
MTKHRPQPKLAVLATIGLLAIGLPFIAHGDATV